MTVNARLEGGGRTITLTAPGLTGFRGGFAARVVIGGITNVLSSASGTLVGVNFYKAETTPYGQANVSLSTIRLEKEQIELLFRLDQIPGVPVVMLQAGIRNFGNRPVSLISVALLAMDEPGGFVAAGNPSEWLVTGLNNKTPILSSLSDVRDPLDIFEYGGLYRHDGVGFLFGPVGTPVAYVSAGITSRGGPDADRLQGRRVVETPGAGA